MFVDIFAQTIFLVLLFLLLAGLCGASLDVASNRDDFPGRRQGGGTHWTDPTFDVSSQDSE